MHTELLVGLAHIAYGNVDNWQSLGLLRGICDDCLSPGIGTFLKEQKHQNILCDMLINTLTLHSSTSAS